MVQLDVKEFLSLSKTYPVIDVRSPGEYSQGHIPMAKNIPLFDDAERAVIGTTYKQKGKKQAILEGLEIVGPKMAFFVKKANSIAVDNQVLVHCWRGGMRSGSFAWLLNTAGIKAHTLKKGYKGYRNYASELFEQLDTIILLGGETGSGKTEILNSLEEKDEQIIDLEKLANHKGSSFGNLFGDNQPTTEQFQNDLLKKLLSLDLNKRIWIEDESHKIGNVGIPDVLWKKMRCSPIIRIIKSKDERIKNLLKDYGVVDTELLKEGILRIKKKIGGLNLQLALDSLEKGELNQVADICLIYYDKAYASGLYNRDPKLIHNIEISPEMSNDLVVEKILTHANSIEIDKIRS